jgi:hypothetical protein
LLHCRCISFKPRRRIIAAAGGAASAAARSGRSKLIAPGDWCRCSAQWKSARRGLRPCRCAVTCRRTLNPVAEIMPDRCTPVYERTVAKMGSLLPYRRARTLLAEFLPLGDLPTVETTRQRTLRVGAGLEQDAVAGAEHKPAGTTKSIALSIDGGHVPAARQYQGRSFEVLLAQVSNDERKQLSSPVCRRRRTPDIPSQAVKHPRWVSRCTKLVPPQSPCKLSRPSPVKMLDSLRYLLFGLGRCGVVMEPVSSS